MISNTMKIKDFIENDNDNIQSNSTSITQDSQETIDMINAAIRRINPNARLAKINPLTGQLELPYPYLFIKRKGGKLIKRSN